MSLQEKCSWTTDYFFSQLLRHIATQRNSTFTVVAFVPDANPDDIPPVYGDVTPMGKGQYSAVYTPQHLGAR